MTPNELKTVRRILRAIAELHTHRLHQTAALLEEKIASTGMKHLRRDVCTGETQLWDHDKFIASSNELL